MDESSTKKPQTIPVLVTILAIIVALQTLVLIQQGRRQKILEKRQNESTFLPPQNPAFSSRSRSPLGGFAAANPSAYGDPWQDFDAMSRRMNQLMRHAFVFGSPLLQNRPENSGFDFTPAVDLEETKDAYIVKSDLPGLEKDKIDLTVRENVLTIEGVRETTNETTDQKNGYYSQERSYGSFARSLSLPGPVDESKITASYKNGVLVITLPKAAGQKNLQKKVAVQ